MILQLTRILALLGLLTGMTVLARAPAPPCFELLNPQQVHTFKGISGPHKGDSESHKIQTHDLSILLQPQVDHLQHLQNEAQKLKLKALSAKKLGRITQQPPKTIHQAWQLALKIYTAKMTLYQELVHNTDFSSSRSAQPPVSLNDAELTSASKNLKSHPWHKNWHKKKWQQLRPPQKQQLHQLLELQAHELLWLYRLADRLEHLAPNKNHEPTDNHIQAKNNDSTGNPIQAKIHDSTDNRVTKRSKSFIPLRPRGLYWARFKKLKTRHILNQSDFKLALAEPEQFRHHWLQKNKNKWLGRQYVCYSFAVAGFLMSSFYCYQSVAYLGPLIQALTTPVAVENSLPQPEKITATVKLKGAALEQARQDQKQAWARITKLNYLLCDINLSPAEVSQLESDLLQASTHYTQLLTTYGSLLDPEDLDLFIPCVP